MIELAVVDVVNVEGVGSSLRLVTCVPRLKDDGEDIRKRVVFRVNLEVLGGIVDVNGGA